MKEYFLLQYKMAGRKISELGINPVLGYLSGVVGFALIFEYIFFKTAFAKYIVILAALSFVLRISEKSRTEFLMIVFGNKESRRIKVFENLLISLPFSILLVCHNAFIETIALLVVSVFLALYSFNSNLNYSIPTPFYKYPFEFTVGFRKTFYMLPVPYILTFIAISVDNLNLGIFALMLIFLVSLTYYTKPENGYFIWAYSTKPAKFLFKKLYTATFYSACLALPIIIILVLCYAHQSGLIMLFSLIGFAFLWTIVLAKYSAYPNEMNLPEGILIALSIYFPPLLLILLPYFYRKSVKNLNFLLK